jgi:hypothetical protein
MRDLAGAIIAARRTHEALVSQRATRGTDLEATHRAEAEAQFRELATALDYLVEKT